MTGRSEETRSDRVEETRSDRVEETRSDRVEETRSDRVEETRAGDLLGEGSLGSWTEPVLGAVLCGGRSSRFGSDKALAPFRSSTVGGRIVDALRGAGVDPVVAIGGRAGHQLGVPTVADRRPGDGPLAGLASALLWAKSGWVVVVPCDVPLLEAEHVRQLLEPGPDPEGRPLVATSDGEPRISLSVWPAGDGRRLLGLLDAGERRFRAALTDRDWRGVELPASALADADTPQELALLEHDAD